MRKHFVAGVYHLRRLPLGGKLSPKVTDEGATDLPNGAGEKFRWGDIRAPLFCFYKERLGTGSPPHPPQCAHWGTFPPRGRLWAVLPFPSAKPPPPARPAGGRAVTGVRYRAAGQAEKREDPRRVPPTRKGGSREEEPLPPWCSFLRLSSKESRRKEHQGQAPGPRVLWPLVPTRWFLGSLSLIR